MQLAYELIIFDLAGTTVHDGDAVNAALRAALHQAGLRVPPAAVNRVMGLPKPEALRLLIQEFDASGAVLGQLEQIHSEFAVALRRHYQTGAQVREIAGASAVFRALHEAGVMVALNTGFSREITETLLERLGWDDEALIDATISSDEVERGRPFPDMIQRLMAQLNVRHPQHVVKVGDTPSDILEGRNAGCGLVIAVTQGSHTRAELLPCGADALLGTVAELPAFLGLAPLLNSIH
jgi:phosphonatase-like hydrolase